jgi:hypothetical protein
MFLVGMSILGEVRGRDFLGRYTCFTVEPLDLGEMENQVEEAKLKALV